jgi:hypothetical protein
MKAKRKNGKVAKSTTHNKEYKIITAPDKYECDWDYGWNFNHGNLPNHKWREFRTWKHSRKTQWK